MKFDYIIGNPPYQEEAPGTSTSDTPVYHIFMDAVFELGSKVEMISPARFLFNAGGTPSGWNRKMLGDPHFKLLYYEADTARLFPAIQIPGGIAVTYRDPVKDIGPIGQFSPFTELVSINNKVQKAAAKSLNSLMYSQCRFDLDRLYKDFPQMKGKIGNNGKDRRFRQIVMERFPHLFAETANGDAIRTLGLIGRRRAYRYIKRCYVEPEKWIDAYKVFVPFSNGASGTLGEAAARLISKPVLGCPGDGLTQTFIGVGSFRTEKEARHLLKYINSKFARALLGILKVTQGNKPETWKYVPLQDFSAASDIDWSTSIPEIDRQLYEKYGLDAKEIEFIETHVKEME